MIRMILSLLFIVAPSAVFASSAAHGEVPLKMIYIQIGNVLIVVGLLYWILKHKINIAELFETRKNNFTLLMEKAESAKTAAEEAKKQLKDKLNVLEGEALTNNERAKQEALELKRKILKEAEEISNRLIEEAQKTAEYELEKAKLQLKSELLEDAVKEAQKNLKSKVTDQDLSKLQSDFVEKIQVVQ